MCAAPLLFDWIHVKATCYRGSHLLSAIKWQIGGTMLFQQRSQVHRCVNCPTSPSFSLLRHYSPAVLLSLLLPRRTTSQLSDEHFNHHSSSHPQIFHLEIVFLFYFLACLLCVCFIFWFRFFPQSLHDCDSTLKLLPHLWLPLNFANKSLWAVCVCVLRSALTS